MIKFITIIAVLAGLIGAGVFGGYQWSEADNAKKVTALNTAIYDLGIVIQTQTNKTAEVNRNLKIANRGRIDAIKTNDHITETVKRLQDALDKANERTDPTRYIVLSVDAVKRVYDQSRNECNGLARSIDPPIIPRKLSEFTGDSITGVVRSLVGSRCEIATDYNNLYKDCAVLLEAKTRP